MNHVISKQPHLVRLFGPVWLTACLLAAKTAPAADLHLVPWPKTVKVGDSMLEFAKDTRIVATDPSLAPLAKVLADELFLVLGQQYAVAQGEAKDGDIVLKLDPALKGEAYAAHGR